MAIGTIRPLCVFIVIFVVWMTMIFIVNFHPKKNTKNILFSICCLLEGNISVSQLLYQLNLKLGIRDKDLIPEVIRLANRSTDVEEFMHSLSALEEIPQLGIFSILKCNEKFSNLK